MFVVLVCYVHCGCCAFCGGVFDGCVERIFCVLGGLWLVVCVFGVWTCGVFAWGGLFAGRLFCVCYCWCGFG